MKRNTGKSYNLHVKHNWQVFQCVSTLSKEMYID